MTFQTFARLTAVLAVAATLSACASKPQLSAQQESNQYRSRAGRNYTPPGPASDPWGPYIVEAAAKFDVPERWIREVMRQESGGRLYGRNGDLVTSGAGAMGLMQVMPATYDEIRGRYPELGGDPYDPHNNIMAGTAYIREMYDIYGSPGFLAAYNAGPGRLDDYLTRNRTLPEETRRYVASIGPKIAGSSPSRSSPGEQYAMNAVPFSIPDGPRYAASIRYSAPSAPIVLNPPAPVQYAALPTPLSEPARPFIRLNPPSAAPVQVASLPEPTGFAPYREPSRPEPSRLEPYRGTAQTFAPTFAPTPAPSFAQMPEPPRPPAYRANQTQLASAALTPLGPRQGEGRGFSLFTPANAAPIPRGGAPAGGSWAVQVGAFANPGLAASATTAARDHAGVALAAARPSVTPVRQGQGTLYRARLGGLSRDAAAQACERLARARTNCIVVSPDAQS